MAQAQGHVEQISFKPGQQSVGGRNFLISQRRTHLLDDNDRTLIAGAFKDGSMELRPRPALNGAPWTTVATTTGPDYQILGAYYWPTTEDFYWVTKAFDADLSSSAAATLRNSTSVSGNMSSLQVMGSTTEVYAHFEEYRFGSTHYLLVSIGTQMWRIDSSNTVTQITDADLPTHQPKFAVLDGYVFVAKKNSQDIFNCLVGDVDTWQASTFIRCEADASNLQGVAKLGQYIVAVKPNSCEFFRDAAIPAPNSPLQRVAELYKNAGASSSISFHVDGDVMYMWGTSKGSTSAGLAGRYGALWTVTEKELQMVPGAEIIDPTSAGQVFIQVYTMPRQRKVVALRFYALTTWISAYPLVAVNAEDGSVSEWTHQISSAEDQPDDSDYWMFGTFSNGYLFPLTGYASSGVKAVNFLEQSTPYETLFSSGDYRLTGVTMRIDVPLMAPAPSLRVSLRSAKLLSPSIAYSALGGAVNDTIDASVELIHMPGNRETRSSVTRTWAINTLNTASSINVNQLTLFAFGQITQGVLRYIIPTAVHSNGSAEIPAWDFSIYGIDLSYATTTLL